MLYQWCIVDVLDDGLEKNCFGTVDLIPETIAVEPHP